LTQDPTARPKLELLRDAFGDPIQNSWQQGSDQLLKVTGTLNPQPVSIYDANGNPIGTSTIGTNTSLNVNIEDVDIQMVNNLFHNLSGTTFTLASGVAAGATEITVTDATGLSVNDRLVITEGGNFEITLPAITAIATNTLTLDGPLDKAYTTAATIELCTVNMAVSGSLASPVSYIVKPHSTQIWHLTRLNLAMIHKSAATDALFGSLAAITNGVVLRATTALNGVQTFANWKKNQHIKEDMYDVTYSDKAGPSLFGTSGRWSFEQRTGAVIRLDGAENDEVEILIQDDLTASSNEIADFQVKIQGHVEVVG